MFGVVKSVFDRASRGARAAVLGLVVGLAALAVPAFANRFGRVLATAAPGLKAAWAVPVLALLLAFGAAPDAARAQSFSLYPTASGYVYSGGGSWTTGGSGYVYTALSGSLQFAGYADFNIPAGASYTTVELAYNSYGYGNPGSASVTDATSANVTGPTSGSQIQSGAVYATVVAAPNGASATVTLSAAAVTRMNQIAQGGGGLFRLGFWGQGGSFDMEFSSLVLQVSGAFATPTVTSVAPNTGSTSGGQVVVLTGTNLTGTTDVAFGSVPASAFTVNSNTQITATAPALSAGSGNVRVTTPGGTSATGSGNVYTAVAPAPTISAISPAEGAADASAPPASVTITGTNFLVSGNVVTFGGTPGTVVTESATRITVTPPARATAGQVNVVVNPGGGSATATNAYRYLLPPVVSVSWSPDTVVGTQNTTFTLSVTNPNGVALSNVRVASNGANTPFALTQFGGTCGSGTYNANSSFILTGFTLAANATCTVTSMQQATAAGAYQFVTNAPTSTGTATTNVTLTGLAATSNMITVYQTPSVSSASPNNGPLVGGTSITITGQRFYGATAVTIDGVPATSFTVVSDTSITATVPAGASAGAKTIAVTGPGGTGNRAGGFTYNPLPAAPTITAPANGGSTSAQPTYSGTRSSGDVTVYVDGASIGTATATGLSWSLQQPTALAGGSHTVTATSTTVPGGTSAQSATTTFDVDATPPAQPTIVQPFPFEIQNRTPTLTGTAEAGSTVTVYANNNPIGTTTATGGAWSFTTTTLVDGAYTFRVTATDAAGNVSPNSATIGLKVDNVAPAAATITSPVDGLVTSANPTYSGTGEPGSILELRFNGGTTLTGLQVDGNGAWSFTFPGNGLGNGTYVFSVIAADPAGNAAPETVGPTFTIDRVAPAAPAITSHTEGEFRQTRDAYIVGTAEPNAIITVTGSYPQTLSADGAGAWSYLAPAVGADGPVSISVTATDAAGNVSIAATRGWTVDTVAPAVPVFTSPSEGQVVNQRNLSIQGTIEPFAHVNILLDGQPVAGFVTGAGGTFSYTVANVADGSHTLSARAADRANNASVYSAARSFTVDATAPSFPTLTTPAPGSTTSNTTPTLSGAAETGSVVTIYLNDFFLGQVTAAGGVWTFPVTTPLPDADHQVKLTALDTAFNSSGLSPAIPFRIDATAPSAPTITAPLDGSVTDNARPIFSGTAEDGSTVTLTFTGGATGTATATGGTWSYTPTTDLTPGSNTIQVTATDTVGNVSPAASVTFTYSPVTITTTSLPAGQVGAAYAETLSADGGATPYAFAVTAGALPTGLTLSSGGAISGTPTDSGTFNFTVTVTEGNGLTDEQSYAVTITTPAVPDADPETVEVPATSSTGPTPVDLSGSVQNAAAIEIVTPPAQGSVTVNGLTVIYTPEPGFFGTVTFTYKAIGFSDGNGAGAESAPATVTITIAAPTLTLGGGALADGQIAQPYSTVFAAADGTAPYTYAITAGALPSGLTLASDGTLSGTPTAGGTFSFTVTATDSSTGTGPFSVSAANSLTVGAPAMSLTPATLPAATVAQSYSQSFAAAGGVAPYTYAVTAGALPAGLTLASSGALSGTPTAGGTFNFTVTATDSATGAGPYTASQAIALTVNGSTIAVTPTALAAGTRGVAYSQSVSANGGVAPYTYAVVSGALPAGLILSPQGVITGTPTAVGAFTFGIRATDSATGSGPYQGVTTVTLTVGAAAISVTPTTLPEVLAGTPFSQQMQASGGQGGYTYSLTDSGLPTGLTLSPSGLISGRAQISGVFVFTVTARDGFGNTGSVALSLTVNGRPDPSADADVRALSTAQAEATRRMAGAQIEQFNRRLEALHNPTGPGQVELRLNLDGNAFTPLDSNRATMGELAQATGRPGLDDRDLTGRGELARMMDGRRPDAVEAPTQGAPGPANGSVETGGLRIWAGGAISLGERDATSQTAEFRIHTSGVSAGADMRITDTLDFGLGVGFGQERTEVGDADSRMDADSWVGVAYGSWRPAESIFVDGVLGYGQMSFDTRRTTPVDSSLVTGSRDGSTWFGSVSAGVDRTFGQARWIGYGRVEALNASLDAYTETGSPIWALSYDERELDSLQGALGLRYERVFAGRDFTWTPGMRLELRREFSEGGAQTLRYADWLDGPAYAIGQEGWGRSEVNLGLTFDFKGADGWSFSTGADTRLSDEQWMASMKLMISKVF